MKDAVMKKYILLICGLCLFSFESQAQIEGLNLEQIQNKLTSVSDSEFKAMDSDGDGLVSQEEYLDYVLAETRAKSMAAFKQIDQDGDNNVSHQEYSEFMNFATGKMNEFLSQIKSQQQ